MKKILVVLVLLMAMVIPMFAADVTNGAQSADPAKLVVTTTVQAETLFGFAKADVSSVSFADLKSSLESVIGANTSWSLDTNGLELYAFFKTNAPNKATVKLTHTNLKYEDTGNNAPEVELTLNGKKAGTEIEIIKDERSGARVYCEKLTLAYDPSKCAAGTYNATLTLTVTGI